MNTKQLWNALTLNPVTNNNFDGIFSIDTLKEIKEKPTLIVCNTDPSDKADIGFCFSFTIKLLIAGLLEAAYSLNWGAQKIWGKGGGETLTLL